jgi:hypothetical protein
MDYASHSLKQLQDACRAKGLATGGTEAVLRARLEATRSPNRENILSDESLH